VNGALGDEFTGDPDFTYPYYGAVGPAFFGTATNTLASSISGHLAGVITNGDSSFVVIYIEEGYVSGDALDGVATYDHQTLLRSALRQACMPTRGEPVWMRIPSLSASVTSDR
jgi:hypothetical protein